MIRKIYLFIERKVFRRPYLAYGVLFAPNYPDTFSALSATVGFGDDGFDAGKAFSEYAEIVGLEAGSVTLEIRYK